MNRLQWKEWWRYERLSKKEIWIDIDGWDGKYKVSNLWRVKSTLFTNGYWTYKRDKILKPYKNKLRWGYLYINLEHNNKRKNCLLNRIVAETFISNPENKPQVNHKNWIKDDNRVDNLEWVTDKENKKHWIEKWLLYQCIKNCRHKNTWWFWKYNESI